MKMPTVISLAFRLLLLVLTAPTLAAAADWGHMNQKEKDTIRRNYQRWEKLPPRDKENLREEWDRFQRLPQNERDRIKQRFNDQRRGQNE